MRAYRSAIPYIRTASSGVGDEEFAVGRLRSVHDGSSRVSRGSFWQHWAEYLCCLMSEGTKIRKDCCNDAPDAIFLTYITYCGFVF